MATALKSPMYYREVTKKMLAILCGFLLPKTIDIFVHYIIFYDFLISKKVFTKSIKRKIIGDRYLFLS